MKQVINTSEAPSAIGTYSQAIKVAKTVYFSGQIPIDPKTMELLDGSFKAQVRQIFLNLKAIAEAAGGALSHIVKLTVYLADMDKFSEVNEVMQEFYDKPYPARAVIAVKALPKGAEVEVDAIMVLGE